MKKFHKILFIFLFVFLLVLGLENCTNADTGPKPSITIRIENLKTDNYLIDLLVYDETGEYYDKPLNYNGNNGEESEQYDSLMPRNNSLKSLTVEQLEMLHDINFDGWISESTRWSPYLLHGNCNGNSKHINEFSYFGTPTRYKVVIINLDTNETKVTDEIHRTEFTSNISVDYKTMKVESHKGTFNIIKHLSVLVITIVVEVIIALIMKIRNIKVIVITNLVTNILLQLILYNILLAYKLSFFIMEILIFVAELYVYNKKFKNVSKERLVLYTFIANLITMLLSFFVVVF